jgi:hypothetical protein
MLPVQVEFPKFVADQLLTSEDLNQLFGYLDEQNRLTRTNLIGIGIVCGLNLQVNNAKTTVTITKGCGVTSEGYLITVNTNQYSQYKKYKVDTPRVYDKFYKTVGPNKVPMDIWELKKPGVDPDLVNIDEAFLKNKVILLFVELKEEDNKNCDPNSCDDKGINVTVSFLPMAVDVEDAKLLMGATGGSFGVNTYTALPELRMRRWDVPNTTPVTTEDIFKSYLAILDKNFIDKTETTLSSVYSVFGSLVAPEYTTNPFTGLSAKFNFLYNGGMSINQLIHLQYYYDLFSDLLLAYQEFRKAGTHVLSTCCPDSSLFPRHLLLGEAIPSVTSGIFPYRHYFIYSPLFDQNSMMGELISLFRRLVLLTEQFFLSPVQGNNTKEDEFLRITPSLLWDAPLSYKAIPYYYTVNSGPKPLYLSWDYRRTLLNDATRNLSYHSKQYNSSDDFVNNPLNYDLEPYNFLRVEGIVGKPYVHVLSQVKSKIQKNRLPVDIIALSTETASKLTNQLGSVNRFDAANSMEMLCHFQDLESMYDSMRHEILCMLCKELKYYYDFSLNFMTKFLEKFQLAGQTSTVSLFNVCSKGYKIKDKSLGLLIELFHRNGLTDETLTLESFFEVLFGADLPDVNNDDIPDNFNVSQSTIWLTLLNFFKVPLGIIRLSTLLTEDLAEFDATAYCKASEKLAEYAKSLKALFAILTNAQRASLGAEEKTAVATEAAASGNTGNNISGNALNKSVSNAMVARLATTGNGLAMILLLIFIIEDLMDHFDALIYNCKCSALLSLKKDYMRRYLMLTRLRQFGYFSKMHPGLQHKAGVTMGGTFIIVYHARRRSVRGFDFTNNLRSFTTGVTANINDDNDSPRIIGGKIAKQKDTIAVGIVLDENQKPVAGATVSIAETGESTTTTNKGSFILKSSIVPYTLLVEAPGFEEYEEVKTDDDDAIVVRLKAAAVNILDEINPGTVIADFYLPYRCCSDCPPIQYVVTEPKEPPPPPNQGPIANAGPDQVITLPVNSVTLNGAASTDPDGTITFFQWIKLSGPSVPQPSIITPNSAQTDVKDLVRGIYEFELTVTDDSGSIARDKVQITVNPAPPDPNKPPVANAGPDQSIVMSFVTVTSVILDGSNSKDDDGNIVAYKWTQVSTGPSQANIISDSLEKTPVTGFVPGVYTFKLVVTDNDGATGEDTVTITVAPAPNKAPTANAGVDRAVTITPNNNSTQLDGSASTDPEGGLLKYNWKVVQFPPGAAAPTFTDATVEKPIVNGLVGGGYEFELTVTDDKGASDSDTVVLKVEMSDVPQKVCGPLSEIIGDFRKLPEIDPQQFSQFREVFRSYNEVEAYFKLLTTIVNKPVADQIDFFGKPVNGEQLQDFLIKWLSELHAIIINTQQAVLRIQALFLYKILNSLAMYIVCIQREDFDIAKVPMTKVFTTIRGHVKMWVELISTGVFKQNETDMVKAMGNDIENEIQRVTQNGEAAAKPKYMRMLKQILDMIKSI